MNMGAALSMNENHRDWDWVAPNGNRVPYREYQMYDLSDLASEHANYHGDSVHVTIQRWPKNTTVVVEYVTDLGGDDMDIFEDAHRILKLPHSDFDSMDVEELEHHIIRFVTREATE